MLIDSAKNNIKYVINISALPASEKKVHRKEKMHSRIGASLLQDVA